MNAPPRHRRASSASLTLGLVLVVVVVACGVSKREVDDGGGAGGSGASGGSGGSGMSGVGGCTQVPCVNIGLDCPDGKIVRPACGCPTCSCDGVLCETPNCPFWEVPTRRPGACCDTCEPPPLTAPPPECANAPCTSPFECDRGFELTREPGACCAVCRPPDYTGCCDLGCPPAGCAPGSTPDACLGTCVPDPLWCETDDQCVIAVDASECCSCPRVISGRAFADDPCFVAPGSAPPASSACESPTCADVSCGECPLEPVGATCDGAQCAATYAIPL